MVCYHFAIKSGIREPKTQCLCGFTPLLISFPLHRTGRFGSDVVDHAVDMFYLVGDAVADSGQDIIGNTRPIGSHKVIRGNGTNGHQVIVGAMIAHHAHRLDAGQHAEELGHLFLVSILGHLVPQDPIRLLQHPDLIRGDLA